MKNFNIFYSSSPWTAFIRARIRSSYDSNVVTTLFRIQTWSNLRKNWMESKICKFKMQIEPIVEIIVKFYQLNKTLILYLPRSMKHYVMEYIVIVRNFKLGC